MIKAAPGVSPPVPQPGQTPPPARKPLWSHLYFQVLAAPAVEVDDD